MDRKIYTHQEVIDIIKTQIAAKSSDLSDFTPGSNLMAMVDAFASFIEYLQTEENNIFESFSIQGIQDEELLQKRAKDFGMTLNPATNATGIITFKRNTPSLSSFTIAGGDKVNVAQVSTNPDIFGNTIDYILSSDLTFPSGVVEVTGNIQCLTEGVIGNVPSGTIINMTSSILGIDSVVNPTPLQNGAEQESVEGFKKRLPIFLNGLKAGNESAIRSAATSVPGVSVVRIDENYPTPGQVTVYVSTSGGADLDLLLDTVKDRVEAASAFGIKTNVVAPTVTNVSISMTIEYDYKNYDKDLIVKEIKDELYKYVCGNAENGLKLINLNIIAYQTQGVKNVRHMAIQDIQDDFIPVDNGVVKIVSMEDIIITMVGV